MMYTNKTLMPTDEEIKQKELIQALANIISTYANKIDK
jgi:hypothetical protein